MIKLGVIGAGGYAFDIIKRIWQIPDKIRLVGVCSNPARKSVGRQACLDKNIPVYDTADELLSKLEGKAEVIFVPTPINTHFSLAKRCLDFGYEVFLEKPPVATIQELDELISYSSTKEKSVAVTFQCIYTSLVREIKKRIVSGDLGKVIRVKGMAGWLRCDNYYSRSNWAGKIKCNGNWVLDGTVNNPLAHMLTNQLYFASMKEGKLAEPKTIEAELYKAHDIESEDTSSIRIETKDGVEIFFNTTLCSKGELQPDTIVECENAVVRYINFDRATIIYNDGRTENLTELGDPRVNMLKRLAECYISDTKYDATLEFCRPFTLCVNGAFDSCGEVNKIDNKYISRIEHSETIKTIIEGIDYILEITHANAKLFSDIPTPWAVKSKKINLEEYKKFPTNECFHRFETT